MKHGYLKISFWILISPKINCIFRNWNANNFPQRFGWIFAYSRKWYWAPLITLFPSPSPHSQSHLFVILTSFNKSVFNIKHTVARTRAISFYQDTNEISPCVNDDWHFITSTRDLCDYDSPTCSSNNRTKPRVKLVHADSIRYKENKGVEYNDSKLSQESRGKGRRKKSKKMVRSVCFFLAAGERGRKKKRNFRRI